MANPTPQNNVAHTVQQPASIPTDALKVDADMGFMPILLGAVAIGALGFGIWRWQKRDMGLAVASGAATVALAVATIGTLACGWAQDPVAAQFPQARNAAIAAGVACLLNVGCGGAMGTAANWADVLDAAAREQALLAAKPIRDRQKQRCAADPTLCPDSEVASAPAGESR